MARPRAWPMLRAGLITLTMILGMIDSCIIPQTAKLKRDFQKPFAPLLEATRIAQRWALFDGASRTQYRMHVEVQNQNQEWIKVFSANSDVEGAYDDILEYRRVRGAWNPRRKQPTGVYHKFSTWILTRVLADHDDALAARVVMDEVKINTWGGMTVVKTGLFPKVRRHRPGSGTP